MSLASVERYRRDRVPRRGERATVLGASVAGLLAARVLADAFDRVTVVDRDPLHADGAARRGVPQGAHVHALMSAGQVTMEDLLPGFSDELSAAGAVVLDISREFGMHLADGFLAEGDIPTPLFFASRPLIERTLRARVAAHDGVVLQTSSQVTDLSTPDDREVIAGVTVLRDGEPQTLPAELVVDATGRASRAPTWLQRLGYAAPPVEEVHVDLAYRTCQVKRPAEDQRGMLVAPSPPRARAGFLVPIEDDRWIVTLSGLHGDHPPADLDGLRAFAASLPTPVIREVLDQHPLAAPEIAHYRFPTQTRRRYERLKHLPARLISIGDAIASFNPVYGQGMSVAALQALGLHHTLAEHDPGHLTGPFYRRIAGIIDGAWNMAAGGDFAFPQTRGDKPRGTDVVNRYITRLQRKAQHDRQLADTFRRVSVMQLPPTAVFRPQTAWRVLRPA